MKFEVTTMLPVHTTAVKRRLLKLRGYRYTAVGFQLNDVIALTAIEEYDVIRKITRSKIIKQEVKRSSVVCPYEGFKSMGVKVITTQEMCKL